MRLCYSILIILSLLLECSEDKRSATNTIARETFTQVYIDLLIAGESGYLSPADTTKTATKKAAADSIFTKYGVTESQVRKTIEEYKKDLRLWKEFYDDVIKRLEEIQREELTKKQSKVFESGQAAKQHLLAFHNFSDNKRFFTLPF